MRAGQLDRSIRIDRMSSGEPDDFGTVVSAFRPVARLRAQIVQASTEEFMRAYGISDETVAVFRTRYLAGVTTSDRIHYAGADFNIKEVKEIGRRNGLELRAVGVGREGN